MPTCFSSTNKHTHTHTHTQTNTHYTMQLNICKPVSQVIQSICGMYGIGDHDLYYLRIPTGIQQIVAKYGGRPVSNVMYSNSNTYSGTSLKGQLSNQDSF